MKNKQIVELRKNVEEYVDENYGLRRELNVNKQKFREDHAEISRQLE